MQQDKVLLVFERTLYMHFKYFVVFKFYSNFKFGITKLF